VGKVIYGTSHVISNTATQHYVGNFVYDNNKTLHYIQTEEGRILKPSGYIDHLGNARAVVEGTTGAYTLVQRNDYYPFGSLFEKGLISTFITAKSCKMT
jgi:hypothetical protein